MTYREQRPVKVTRNSANTNAKKRILFVANTDWYLFNFRFNLLERTKEAGYSVELACPDKEHTARLKAAGHSVHAVPFDTKGINPLGELRALVSLARVLRRVQPDVIHLFTLKCVLYGCLASLVAPRVRVIGAITGMGHLFTTRSWRTQLLKTPVLWGLKVALHASKAQLIFQNSADRDEFVNHGLITHERTKVIRGSGVDCQRFNPTNRKSNGWPLKLMFCGRLLAEKGIAEYLSATGELQASGVEFHSLIAGAPYLGNPSSMSQAEADKLRDSSQHDYLGHSKDMAPLFAAADVVILPTYREGTPKALLEAAASGCIIITTDIPGCEGIVDPGINGELVPTKEVAPLVAAIKRIIEATPEARAAMSRHSRHIALERFSDVQVNQRTLALYSC